jgi:hypothetical protein
MGVRVPARDQAQQGRVVGLQVDVRLGPELRVGQDLGVGDVEPSIGEVPVRRDHPHRQLRLKAKPVEVAAERLARVRDDGNGLLAGPRAPGLGEGRQLLVVVARLAARVRDRPSKADVQRREPEEVRTLDVERPFDPPHLSARRRIRVDVMAEQQVAGRGIELPAGREAPEPLERGEAVARREDRIQQGPIPVQPRGHEEVRVNPVPHGPRR